MPFLVILLGLLLYVDSWLIAIWISYVSHSIGSNLAGGGKVIVVGNCMTKSAPVFERVN